MTLPGEEAVETPYDYIDGTNVRTKFHERRTRPISVDQYRVTLIENLAPEDRLPIKLTVELAVEGD